jgi:hypothetical protein
MAGAVLATNTSSIPSLTATPTLGVAGFTVGTLSFANATSGAVTIQPATGALGAAAATLPAGSYNVVGDSISQTLTNKTISGAGNTLTVRLASDVTGALPFANLPTGTQDTVAGYWGSTTLSAIAVNNCTGALTYSTSTHTFGCNVTAGTGTVTSVATAGLATGGPITTTGTVTVTAATKSDQQTATSTTTVVTPAQQQSHPSADKAWVRFTGSTAAISDSFNVTSVSRAGAGNYTINFTTAFANTNYGCVGTAEDNAQNIIIKTTPTGKTASAQPLFAVNLSATTVDPDKATIICKGTQ